MNFYPQRQRNLRSGHFRGVARFPLLNGAIPLPVVERLCFHFLALKGAIER